MFRGAGRAFGKGFGNRLRFESTETRPVKTDNSWYWKVGLGTAAAAYAYYYFYRRSYDRPRKHETPNALGPTNVQPAPPPAEVSPSTGLKSVPIKDSMLDKASSLLQNFAPLHNVSSYLCGVNFYNGDMGRQVISHRYCSRLNSDMEQCMIYDSPEKHARLIGAEYIITQRLFEQLPPEEKKLWHSLAHDVKSGELVAPRIPAVAENAKMKELVSSYGKTWHLWQVDRGDLVPVGAPRLMMAFTEDNQLSPEVRKLEEKELGVSIAERKKARASIPDIKPHLEADAWTHGEVLQTKLLYIA